MGKTQVLIKTIEKMAQFMRDYPPAEMPEDPNEILLYVDTSTDPKGNRIINYFVNKVLEENE
jgi:hypothetical protein